jgi:hypothetical protein
VPANVIAPMTTIGGRVFGIESAFEIGPHRAARGNADCLGTSMALR